MSTPAAFLDRDGTIIEERNYLDRLDQLTLFPWTVDALRLLKRAGFATVVVTNQSAVARGIIDEAFVQSVHDEIDRRLEGTGAGIDRYYYCPHFAESKIERYRQPCQCRKPAPGMIEQACRELDLDPARSFMVGDRWLDVMCGRAAGTGALLVRSGPERAEAPEGVHADAILNNFVVDGGCWLDSAQLLAVVDALKDRTVAVIGDIVADEFVYGRVARVSREAPVLILEYDSTEVVAGAGGNAANNVAALGGRAILAGVVGRDEPARRLAAALNTRVNHRGVLRVPHHNTPVKTRILAGGVHSAKQQVVRIDRAVNGVVSREVRSEFERRTVAAAVKADAVLVSDYGSGLVTPSFVSKLRVALRREGHPVPILVDSRYRVLDYRDLTACTPNESEVEQALGVRINDDPGVLERAGRELLEKTGMQAVLITRGSRGMALFVPGAATVHIPIFGSDEIADVTGAGDTVMATMALALAAGTTFEAAARLANYAGGIVVMKRGTATVSAEEIRRAVRSDRAVSPVAVPDKRRARG